MVQVGRMYTNHVTNRWRENMKRFWKKKLPAFLLALTLIVGLMPTALAADCGHGNWSPWYKLNDQQHQRRCQTSGCTATQEANHSWPSAYTSDASSHWKKCTDCGAETTHEAHTYGGTMKYDSSNHWDQCTVCGHQDNLGGHVDLDNDGKCDTCGYSVGITLTVTFMNGSGVYRTQSVKKGSAPSNPGTPTKSSSGKSYTFKGWTTKNPGSSALYDGQSYLTSSQVAKTSLSANTTYYALYTTSSSSSSAISYKVSAGESVSLDRSDFKDFYDDETGGGTLYYVSFDPGSSYKSSYGYLYYDYDGTDEEKFSKSSLSDTDFYYSKSKYGEYPLSGLSFVAAKDASSYTLSIDCTLYGEDEDVNATVKIKIGSGSSSSKADIVLEVAPGEDETLDRAKFKEFFEDECNDTFRSVVFTPDSSYKSSNGYLYYDYDGKNEEKLSKSDLSDYEFTYSKNGDYPISEVSFVADEDADGETVTLEFIAYGDDDEAEGVFEIRIGDVDEDEDEKGDIDYTVEPGDSVELDRSDFNSFFKEEYSKTLSWVTFSPDSSYKSSNGCLYYNYDGKKEEKFTKSALADASFYYKDDDYGDYPLDDLTFVADDEFDGTVTLDFTAWYDDDTYVEGVLTIRSDTAANLKSSGNILYYTTYSSSVQINHNDFAHFFKQHYPSNSLQYVKITGVPTSGSVYYDYYGASKYGSKVRLTADNCKDYYFYFSPDSTKEYALSELSFTPSGFNYCPVINFTAYGTGSKSVAGSILISATLDSMPEVYGVTPKGTAVSFPASSLASAVSKGTGLTLGSIRLLSLPESSQGVVYVGSGTSAKANTSDSYGYSSGSQKISSLRFVPASGFTGSVEIPYLAYNTSGNAVAGGKFCLGVVSSVPRFKDVTSSTWCYKYVVEMSDADVIDGYADGSFRPNNTVTYGQALKLIMLAAGYKTQDATGSHWASGYLAKAKSDKLISGSVDLDAPITRLAVAQVAAKAMKLSTSDLSSVKPFTDTSDVYVQALSAAGIVQGYFSNGTSTYKPSNTLTRGQIAAIVWRMENYNG